MRQPLQNPAQFGPTQNGVGWPYMILTLIGAVLCFYLAIDLYLTFASYSRTPPRDYFFVVALAGIGMLFLAAAMAFWYFPWSWSSITVATNGVFVSTTGWGAFPQTHFPWDTLSEISVIILPRGASSLAFRTSDGLTKTIRTWSIAANTDDLLFTLGHIAKTAGYELSGPPLNAPILWRRNWTIAPIQT